MGFGFLDKLKGAVSFVTGGGAKVFVTADKPSLEVPFTVKVKAVVADHDLKVDRVYVRLSDRETVEIRSEKFDKEDISKKTIEVQTETKNTFEQNFDIAPAQTLKANQEYEWEGQIEFPKSTPPPYKSLNASHELLIEAGLDTRGNDPSSGWNVLTM